MNKPLVIVTGASSGIGEAIARRFSEAGHPLLLLARRLDRLKSLNLPNSICAQVDVIDAIAFKKAIDDAELKYGSVDCLVNNAGIMLLGEMDSQDPGEWKQMLDGNVMGLLNGINLVLPSMKARRCGTIFNMSSIAGRKLYSNHTAYCGTKFAVHAISEGTRAEVADSDVRIITVAPGAVETELITHTTSKEIREDYMQTKKANGSIIKPDDIARAVLFAYKQPQNVCMREIVITATRQRG